MNYEKPIPEIKGPYSAADINRTPTPEQRIDFLIGSVAGFETDPDELLRRETGGDQPTPIDPEVDAILESGMPFDEARTAYGGILRQRQAGVTAHEDGTYTLQWPGNPAESSHVNGDGSTTTG